MKSFTSSLVLLAVAAAPAFAIPFNNTSSDTNQTFSSNTPLNGTGGPYTQVANSGVPLSGLASASNTPPAGNVTSYTNSLAQAANASVPVVGATTFTSQQVFNVTGNTGAIYPQPVVNTTIASTKPSLPAFNGTGNYNDTRRPNHYHDKNNSMKPFDWRKHHQLKNPRFGTNGTSPSTSAGSTISTTSNSTGAALSKRQWGSGNPMTGEATYFYQEGAYGACGQIHQDSDQIVALPSSAYQNGANCGKWITYYNTNEPWNSQGAMVADLCPSCDDNHVDLSTGAFNLIGSEWEGVLSIVWWIQE